MNELKELIYKRKSFRSYTGVPLDVETIQKIEDYMNTLKPLDANIAVAYDIVSKENVKCILPWITPQLIAIYSEEKDDYLENAGFLFQQLELYLQSIGLGTCWLGMGRMTSKDVVSTQLKRLSSNASAADNMKFVILLTVGYPKNEALRSDLSEFNRRSLREISDTQDERLEAARLAPSSVNSQPWFFTHEGKTIHAHCSKPNLLKPLGNMNRIDMGIALAHMYVENPETFQYFKAEQVQSPKGYYYTGSFVI